MKEFKTINELIELLNSRGVATDDATKPAIERESYYAIVNGYKAPYLDTKAMQESSDDVYKEGTQFVWMYDLFKFDRDLRMLTFKYLTRAEAIMRTAVVYSFCQSHPEKDSYLDRACFCEGKDYLVPKAFKGDKEALHADNLSYLMGRLNNKLTIGNKTRDFVKHYMQVHKYVPLWVLSNDLTFGNIVHFYQLMQPGDRERVCSIIARVSQRDVELYEHLTPRRLLRAGNVLNDFRNLCAHDERLYCANLNGDTLAIMTMLMTEILPREEVLSYVSGIGDLLKDYEERLHGISFEGMFKEMGFSIE